MLRHLSLFLSNNRATWGSSSKHTQSQRVPHSTDKPRQRRPAAVRQIGRPLSKLILFCRNSSKGSPGTQERKRSIVLKDHKNCLTLTRRRVIKSGFIEVRYKQALYGSAYRFAGEHFEYDEGFPSFSPPPFSQHHYRIEHGVAEPAVTPFFIHEPAPSTANNASTQ